VLALIRPLFDEVTQTTLPIAVLAVAICFLASLGVSIVGRRALATVRESGHRVGLHADRRASDQAAPVGSVRPITG
jgi:hypothetical protein